LNGVLKIGQTCRLGFALSVRAGNFQAGRPKGVFHNLVFVSIKKT
jgi:hypothetical protein